PLRIAGGLGADILLALRKGFAAELHGGIGSLEGFGGQAPWDLREVDVSLVIHPQDVIAGAVVVRDEQLLKLFFRWRSIQIHGVPHSDSLLLSLEDAFPDILTDEFPLKKLTSRWQRTRITPTGELKK